MSGKLRRNDLLRSDTTLVKFADATKLIWFQTLRLAVYGVDLFVPLINALFFYRLCHHAGESPTRRSRAARTVIISSRDIEAYVVGLDALEIFHVAWQTGMA